MATTDITQMQDPRQQYPVPPFKQQQPIEPPGEESEMNPKADYGEHSYRGSGKLAGRKALITGGDSGIGRAVALAFAREGADVLIAYNEEDKDAQETVRLVEKSGQKAIAVKGDIQQERHCQQLVQRVIDEWGQLDILVNNAAFQMSHQSIAEFSAEEIDRTFRTNVFAMFYLCKAAMPHLKPGASIINTTSIQAYDPKPQLLPYAATKAAIVNFTKAFSEEAMQQGVRVNAVAPGPVWTPLIPSTMPPEKFEEFGADTPLKRPAQPVELAPVYVLLASQEASYITGMIYGVTGGRPLA
ncbi:SDR family oxidoreductase [Spirosoma sp. BT702]|uniref:SDR family oxidoreductase n=1 Tax=Spirosoma profusum TaxID=2771354 RepID=A0A926XY93_9BACT|nr:SDR family oxidoreductase [Spirosoma profusum]MBD2703073.1 SDR family oxidoreductase [Spirosoma profusum]